MRLVCPNCGARYEVDDNAIPEAGRDVQCSNCGHTWLQLRDGDDQTDHQAPADEPAEAHHEDTEDADAAVETAEEQALADADDDAGDDAGDEDQPDEQQDAPDTEEELDAAADEPDDHAGEDTPDETPDEVADEVTDEATDGDSDEAGADEMPKRHAIDPAVLDILREEAEREGHSGHGDGLETQPDLGLKEDTRSYHPASADADPADTTDGDFVAPVPRRGEGQAARSDLLPDIDEINSSLRSASDRGREGSVAGEDAPAETGGRRSGFRAGFILAALIFVVLTLVYNQPGRVIEAMPETRPYVTGLVTKVDKARVWLGETAVGAKAMLLDLTGGDDG